MNQDNNQQNLQQPLSQISETVGKNSSGLIVLPANPTIDAVASATALYLGLTKIGKNISIVGINVPKSDLAASDKIQPNLTTSGDNLVVSFPYSDGSIDKVDYNIQGSTFNLVIVPRPGFPKLDPSKVQFNYSGGKIDFIIVVDAPNLNSLGAVYQENQNEFQGKTVINIDRHLINNSFGAVNLVHKTSSSTSELVLKVLEALRVELDKEIATNLYSGLSAATNNFTSYSVNADTFEAAATLLRFGAIKKTMNRPGGPGNAGPMPGGGNPFMPPPRQGGPQQGQPRNQMPQPMNQQPPMVQQPQKSQQQQAKPIEEVEGTPGTDEAALGEGDWLKPKIFQGQGLV